MTIEERLNGPEYNEPELEESEPNQSILIPKGHGTRPTLRLGTFITEPETPAVPTLNLLEQMQRELTGHESVGLGFARAYALASVLLNPGEQVTFKRYMWNEELYYDFETYLGDIEMVGAQDDGEDVAGLFLVLTDEEADAYARQYIEESVWAFNASFLAGQTGLPESAFEGLSKQCEEGNEPILQMVQATCGIDSFVEAAVSADGRGHFLARYDHEEREFNNGRMTFYIYRIN